MASPSRPPELTAPTPAPTAAPEGSAPFARAATATDAGVEPCTGGTTVKEAPTCADRKAWFAALRWPDDCEQAYEATAIRGSPAIAFHALGKGRFIVDVECTLGAYQGYSIYLLLDESVTPATHRLLEFRTYDAPRDGVLERRVTSELWGLATYDERTNTLTVFNRYRGIGDCGALATYDMRSGTPVVRTFRSKNRCDGVAGPPERWPLVQPP